ncbi:MAG: hypothetical protein EBX95_13185 [Acidimicrobiia bacterium]|nr:hypothetical protein [Actinomycetota bacterium]NDB06653.1 hypothetical protein [Acidimicrobiia bacterium]
MIVMYKPTIQDMLGVGIQRIDCLKVYLYLKIQVTGLIFRRRYGKPTDFLHSIHNMSCKLGIGIVALLLEYDGGTRTRPKTIRFWGISLKFSKFNDIIGVIEEIILYDSRV